MALKRKRIVVMLKEGYRQSEICTTLKCSKRDVSKLAKWLSDIDIGDDELAALSDSELRQLTSPERNSECNYVMPDLDKICQELARSGVTRKLLWYEYGNTFVPAGMLLYQYSQFCKLIERHLNTQGATMRIKHVAGKCMYVDWAGDVMFVRDRITGKDITVYLFVACLPYSGYIYCEGFFDTTQDSWLLGHEHTMSNIGGVPFIIVPDNCATATDKSPIYVTKINSTYMAFAEHYNTAIVPARIRKPKDKAMVEGAVHIVEQWVIAALRNATFFSLAELNEAILEKVAWINERQFSAREGSRIEMFLSEEHCCLKELPATRFERFEWKKVKVSPDYHVQIDYMRYSVPYRLIKETLDARVGDTRIEIYKSAELVASHTRLRGRKGQFSTSPEHMPPTHKHFDSSWSPDRFVKWASRIGPATKQIIEGMLAARPVVEQAYVGCSNVLNLAKRGRAELLEKACERILETGFTVTTYSRVKNLMEAIGSAEAVRVGDVVYADTCAFESEAAGKAVGRTRGAEYYKRDKGDDKTWQC
jgi:transposase